MTGTDAERRRILVVDDEQAMRRALQINLEARGFDVRLATSGEEALALAARTHPDVVLLDLGSAGHQRPRRDRGATRLDERPDHRGVGPRRRVDKVAALDAGADDYISEAVRHGRAAGPPPRRPASAHAHDEGAGDRAGDDLEIDLADRRVRRDGELVHLTPTEWRLLEVVVRNRGRLVTQRQLLQEVWGPGYANESGYLRVHVGNLRRKIEPDAGAPRYLLTEPGMGYRFNADPHS